MKQLELKLNKLSEQQKDKVNEIINYFNDVFVHIEVCLCFDENKEETKLALQKIEEAKFWIIKSIIKN